MKHNRTLDLIKAYVNRVRIAGWQYIDINEYLSTVSPLEREIRDEFITAMSTTNELLLDYQNKQYVQQIQR